MQSYLEVIEELSKSVNLRNGEIDKFTEEILIKSSDLLGCARCNAWLFEKEQSKLASLLSYSRINNSLKVDAPLTKKTLPNYFKFLQKNSLIVSDNARNEPMNSELLEGYIIPNQIMSMIDVPLRSEGKMIGVICFEHVRENHSWTFNEQNFTQSVAQLLSLALETNKKREYRIELEKIIGQKEVLLSEIIHRVKNNMSVIMSLLNLQKSKTKDAHHAGLFDEIKDKVYSMAIIQEQLHTNNTIDRIDLGDYLQNLVANLNNSYGLGKAVNINLDLDDNIGLDVSKAIPCGLISNEILTNSFKYAFNNEEETRELSISLHEINDSIQLYFKDNGPGFDLDVAKSGMGLELIRDLSDQIDAEIDIQIDDGVGIKLLFPSA
ncbi:MAG: GAF domain-containing protein [Crocinitomix sp.]|nr:GAF domain-containing protein [Crocinitomix sp.]